MEQILKITVRCGAFRLTVRAPKSSQDFISTVRQTTWQRDFATLSTTMNFSSEFPEESQTHNNEYCSHFSVDE